MCDRNQNGGALNPHINLDELTLEDCKTIFTPDFISQLRYMFMCGNLGDPIIARDCLEIFQYFRTHNPKMKLGMNTNGGARTEQWWHDLAGIFGDNGIVTFSIDGLEDTNHIYRQGVNWSHIMRSAKAFIGAGGQARWDFLVFGHNEHQVEEARELSKDLGFKDFISKKTGRFITANTQPKDKHEAVNMKGEQTSTLKKPSEKHQNAALLKQNAVLEKYGSMEAYYNAVPVSCKVKGEKSLFITAEGLAMPCCWTAGRMYKWWHIDPKKEQIWRFIDKVGGKEALDARSNGLKAVFNTGIFDDIAQSWGLPSTEQGKLKVCSMKCGKEFDPFGAQFK
jgi:MoaA/NifB/PqqE/SkfB family radical SAM enzyme